MDQPKPESHELIEYMAQATEQMAKDYRAIQKRSSEDAGTAGDQGEEDWANLFRGWLPSYFQVVTKGRILNHDGVASPQVDLLVLSPSYPKNLLNKKYYLAGGVAAAFECKVTLRAEHIEHAIKTAVEIKRFFPKKDGTPYGELHAPLVYGLLAHSHCWKSPESTPSQNIREKLIVSDLAFVRHPREMLDLLCVSDLETSVSMVSPFLGPPYFKNWEAMKDRFGPEPVASTSYIAHSPISQNQNPSFTPIGVLLTNLFQKLAWEYREMRPLFRYFRQTRLEGTGSGLSRSWPLDIYSARTRKGLESGEMKSGPASEWSEWANWF